MAALLLDLRNVRKKCVDHTDTTAARALIITSGQMQYLIVKMFIFGW